MVEAEQQEIDDELEEIKRLIDNKDAANTKRITKLAYNVFSSVVDVAAAEKDLANMWRDFSELHHFRKYFAESPSLRVYK